MNIVYIKDYYLNLTLNIVYIKGLMVDENHPDQSAISPNQEGGEHDLINIYNQKKNLKKNFVQNWKKFEFFKKEINLSKTSIF